MLTSWINIVAISVSLDSISTWQPFDKWKNTNSVQPLRLTLGALISTTCVAKVKLSFFQLRQLPPTAPPFTHPRDPSSPLQYSHRLVLCMGQGWVRGGWGYSCPTHLRWLRCKCVPFHKLFRVSVQRIWPMRVPQALKWTTNGWVSARYINREKDLQSWVTPILSTVNRIWSQGLLPLFLVCCEGKEIYQRLLVLWS